MTKNKYCSLWLTIRKNNVAAGTTLYWSLSGTGITSDDFSSGALTGSGNVGSDGSLDTSLGSLAVSESDSEVELEPDSTESFSVLKYGACKFCNVAESKNDFIKFYTDCCSPNHDRIFYPEYPNFPKMLFRDEEKEDEVQNCRNCFDTKHPSPEVLFGQKLRWGWIFVE